MSNFIIFFFLFFFRTIEEILSAKGESVKRVTDALGTTEITVEDVVGKQALLDAVDSVETKK